MKPANQKPTAVQQTGPWFLVNMQSRWNQDEIMRGQKPTRIHKTLASAYTEAQRLAAKLERAQIAIFECVGVVASNPIKAREYSSEAGGD